MVFKDLTGQEENIQKPNSESRVEDEVKLSRRR